MRLINKSDAGPRMNRGSGPGGKLAIAAAGIVVVGIAVLIINPFNVVESGYVGVMTNFGSAQPTPLNPGLHFAVPFYQSIKMVSVQPQTYTNRETAATHDQQEIQTAVAVTFHVPGVEAAEFYTNFRSFSNFEVRIISPSVSNDVKAITTSYDAEELITKRKLIDSGIKNLIVQSLAPYHITVDAVNIANFKFSSRYMQSIEDKQIAQQKALQAQYTLQEVKINIQQKVATAKADALAKVAEAKGEAQATVISAKAVAEAYETKSKAITPQILRLQAIQQWNGVLPTYLGSSAPVPFLSGKNAASTAR